MTPFELQRRGMKVLIRGLGYADATRFMLQFSRGKDDYTKERRRLLVGVRLSDLLDATEARLGPARSEEGGEARPKVRARSDDVTHRDRVLGFLSSAVGPICDDCLSDRTGITPRQAIFQVCTRLAGEHRVIRDRFNACMHCRKSKLCTVLDLRAPTSGRKASPTEGMGFSDKPWCWEGNVQAALIAWLADEGWAIRSAADTASKAAGKDIVAEREGDTLWVTVKGYPQGTAQTIPSTQARHWFSHAVFDAVRYRDESPSALIGIALPDGTKTYLNLAKRIRWLRTRLPLTIFWIDEAGAVRAET